MKLTTANKIQSKLFPEIFYTVRTLSEGRRQQVLATIADATYQLYDLVGQANALLPVEGEVMDQPTLWKRTALVDRIDDLTKRVISPAWIKTYVVKIEGFDIDGVPATVDTFLAEAPSNLFNECVDLIKGQVELSPEEIKN